MTLDEYQSEAKKTARYPVINQDIPIYPALGLCGEAGEFAEKCKKGVRDGAFDRDGAIRELGDVLWYVAMAAEDLGIGLDAVAGLNLAKLRDRAARDALKGSGDER